MAAGLAVASSFAVVSCTSNRPGITITYVEPDGSKTLEVWTGGNPVDLPPGSELLGVLPDGPALFRAPDGRLFVCIQYFIIGLKCLPVQVWTPDGSFPGGGPGAGGQPMLVVAPPGEPGDQEPTPPTDPDVPGAATWSVTANGAFDVTTDVATVDLPLSASPSWPAAANFGVTVSDNGSVRSVSGKTAQVASYLAESGVRFIRIPASGAEPELVIEIRFGTATPVYSLGGGMLGLVDFDAMYIRYASNWQLVPVEYSPIRPLHRTQ